MSLAWGLPSALALVALVGLPIAAHLSRRMPTERVAFGAMLLLRRLTRRLRRRQRIRDPWLLLLRVLSVACVALAAAAPELSWRTELPAVEGGGRAVVVVDRSRSMGMAQTGGTLLGRALGEARAWITTRPDGAQVGVVLCGPSPEPVISPPTSDRSAAAAALADVPPLSGPCRLDAALLEARRMLGGTPGAVHVFSDEAGPAMIPGASDEIGRLVDAGHALVPHPVRAEPPRNAWPTRAVWEEGLEGGRVVLRVRGIGPVAREVACEVDLPDGERIRVFVEVPPDGEAQTGVTVPRDTRGGVGMVRCDDPDLPLDDRRWFHLPSQGASEVLVVDGDPGDTPTESEVYFLERALAPWGGGRSGVTVRVVGPTGLAALDPAVHAAAFLANVGDPRPFAGRLRDFVRQGGTLVVGVGRNVVPAHYEAALGGLLPSALQDPVALAARGEDPVRLRPPDTSLPLFRPLARGGRLAVARVGTWRVMPLAPFTEGGDVQTLLAYDGGMPALVSRRAGRGQVLVWTSTFDDDWTNLPLQSAFLPLVQQLVGGGGAGGQAVAIEALVGSAVGVPLPDDVSRVWVTGPDGDSVAHRVDGRVARFDVDDAGPYTVAIPDGPIVGYAIANFDPVEGDVRVTHTLAAAGAEAAPEMFTRRAELSSWLLALGLGLGLAAAGLAMRAPPAADDEEVPA